MSSEPYLFCPRCGNPLPEPDDDSGATCSCGRRWYRNPAPTAGCVLVRDGKALITERGSDPEKGRYDIPGGFIEIGETLVEAVKRELMEELNVEVDVTDDDYLQAVPHRYGDDGTWTLAFGFKARLVSGELKASDDVAAFKWVSNDELDDFDFAWEHDRELVRKVLADG